MSEAVVAPSNDSSPPATPDAATQIAAAFHEYNSSKNGLSSDEAKRRLAQYGPNALEDHTESKWHKLLSYFWGPLPFHHRSGRRHLGAATRLAGFCRRHRTLALQRRRRLLAGQQSGERARGAEERLGAPRPRPARRPMGSAGRRRSRSRRRSERRSGPDHPGRPILIDGKYLSCDQASLTGKSLPVAKKVGDKAFSGSIAKQGAMIGVVTATGSKTFFGRTAKLVGAAGAASHSQRAVTQVGDFLAAARLRSGNHPGRGPMLPAAGRRRRLELGRVRKDCAVCAGSADRVDSGRPSGGHVRHDGHRRSIRCRCRRRSCRAFRRSRNSPASTFFAATRPAR